ncbi:MAG: SRPBCC family protein [Kofleriaceae bacterium]
MKIRGRLLGTNIPGGERIASGLVGGALTAFGASRRSLGGIAIAAAGGALVLRALSGRCPAYRARALSKGIQVRRAITIQANPDEIYKVWRDLTNLPRFMQHVRSVTIESPTVSRWVVNEGPKELVWRAEIVEDVPGQLLRWRSLPGGDITNNGGIELRKAPGDRGTIVEVKLHYLPPGGVAVAAALHGFLRKLTGVQVGKELARLRQLLETGEIATGACRKSDLDADESIATADELGRAMPAPAMSAATSGYEGGAR